MRRFARFSKNLKNLQNTNGGMIIQPVTLLKVSLLHYFSCFLNCTNGTKSRK